MTQVFYRKWRPQALSEVVGQEPITRTLLNALASSRVAHAYLFTGPRGTGKTSTGRILAKAVNCLADGRGEPCNACAICQAITQGRALDLVEIDAASNRGIDEIRDLREKVNFAPTQARYKVYIIDEVHMLTEPAFNALLKTLEEPPPHTILILCTTEPHKVPPTILSRCQRFDFRRLPLAAVVKRLAYICDREEIAIEPQALELIARGATGSLRDAENILEQLAISYGSQITLPHVQAVLGITGDRRRRELAHQILLKDIAGGLATLNSVQEDGLDLRQFHRELVEYLRGMLLVKAGAGEAADLSPEEVAEMRPLIERVSLEDIVRAVRVFGQLDLRFDSHTPLPLELALVECAMEGVEEVAPRQWRAAPTPLPPPPSREEATPLTPQPQEIPAGPQDINYLRSRWREVVDALRGAGSKGNLDAFLRSACEPVAIEGDILVVGFYHAFHKEKIEDPKYRHLVEQKLKEVFGFPYKLHCILTPRGKGEPNPLVKAAVEMGGRIVSQEE